jgi:lipoprotein-releasing system permease protein
MYLPFFIARRYLFAKKSHNVINIISMISVIGVAMGTMALIVVLSVYNGFDDLVKSLYNTFDPDLRITPSEGKVFSPHTAILEEVKSMPGVASWSEVLEENVLAEYRGKQDVIFLKGVDQEFEDSTPVHDAMVAGEFSLYHGEVEQAVLGLTIANRLRIGIHFIDPLKIYIPKREGKISLLNPAESLTNDYLYPAGVFAVEQTFDSKYVFVPIAFARRLLDYSDEVSAIEIRLYPEYAMDDYGKRIRRILGSDFDVKDRYQQNETVYAMMRSEKAIIYAILLFIIIIISCNVLGSLAMLIIEKKEDVVTLQSLGANNKLIGRIFLLEGWLISLFGVLGGVVLGLLLCVLQQQFSLVRISGNFLVDAYPVSILCSDVLLVALSVAVIGFVAALLPVRYIKR